jgi:hypothetical protein
LPPGDVIFVDQPNKGTAGLKPPPLLPLSWHSHLVVTMGVAEKIGAWPGVVPRPTVFVDGKGKRTDGYVRLEVAARVPLDRRAARAVWKHGWLDTLEEAIWREGAALPPMFRLLERPAMLFVRRDLADVIVAASKKKVALDDYAGAHRPEVFPPGWSLADLPEIGTAAAEAAFWRRDRAGALADPFWAYAVAATHDQAPQEDTRRAACKSPLIAVLYAIDVDRQASDTTRSAACEHGLSAWRYAAHFDSRLDPALRKRIIADAGHDERSLADAERHLPDLAAWLAGGEARQTPLVASRVWPDLGVARFAENVRAQKREEIAAWTQRGYERLQCAPSEPPHVVVEALHRYVDRVQAGTLVLGQKKTAARELAAVWAEQLWRAFGWQWRAAGAKVELGPVGGAQAQDPQPFIERHLGRRASENTIALEFNMLLG